jgi:hypothetical protein
MKTAYRLELTDEYLKEAQRLAIACPRGILLKLKSQSLYWLADRSLSAGSPAQARQQLVERAKGYVVNTR